MEQRPLRLGDTVDDYCPRERRITNHAILVVAGDDIQQTRCTACEAEHPYKHGKAPLKRKKDANGELYDEVLAGVLKPKASAQAVESAQTASSTNTEVDAVVAMAEPLVPAAAQAAVTAVAVAVAVAEPEAIAEPEPAGVAWGHRPLIRAQLPRVEGQAPVMPRPLPEFTIRQQGSRGYGQPNQNNGSRRGQGGGHNNGNGSGGGQSRRDQGGRSQGGRSRHSR